MKHKTNIVEGLWGIVVYNDMFVVGLYGDILKQKQSFFQPPCPIQETTKPELYAKAADARFSTLNLTTPHGLYSTPCRGTLRGTLREP